MLFSMEAFRESFASGMHYLPNTILLTLIPVVVGIIIGTVIAIICNFKVPVISQILNVYVAISNGVPIIASLMIFNLLFLTFFNDVALFLNLSTTIDQVNNIWVGIIALTFSSIGYMSEAIRGAFFSVEKGQYEAAYSAGLTTSQTLTRIIIPQVIAVCIPPVTSNVIGILKGSSVVLAIGIFDVLNGALNPSQTSLRFLEGYLAGAIIYWILAILIEILSASIEKRYSKFRRELA